jgi:RsiW-degrading membrane proteinase PrsW (M82 family)
MLLALPSLMIYAVYIVAAVAPAVFLLRYIYKKDVVEKEPLPLLLVLLVMGVLAALASIILETIGTRVLDIFVDSGSKIYVILLAFLVVAAVEEGTKLFFLRLRTWRDPNFNFTFDAVVYSVFVSLGFAAFENIKYVLGYGLSVALPRRFLRSPAIWASPCLWGFYYGRAKLCERAAILRAANGTSARVISSPCCSTGSTTPAR